ncbi:MAG: hypothetical protein KJ847_04345, partial [Firmicutes bacterium]|nr:hypothetical protein [Bacillota bacterium]
TEKEIYQQYISNLNKFSTTQWYLYINQSRNATDGLSAGNYTYQAFASDIAGNANLTEERTIIIGEAPAADTTPPYYNTTDYVAWGTNTTGSVFYYNVTWKDDVNVSTWVLSENQTGSWVNHTQDKDWVSKGDGWYTAVMNFTINAITGVVINVIGYANDTSGNWNNTWQSGNGINININVLDFIEDLSFTISYPITCSDGNGCYGEGCNECTYCNFNFNTPDEINTNCTGQNDTTSFFVFTNTGNVNYNITWQLNQSLESYLTLQFNNESNSAESVGVDENAAVIIDNFMTSTIRNIWLWGNVSSGLAGSKSYIINSSSIAIT